MQLIASTSLSGRFVRVGGRLLLCTGVLMFGLVLTNGLLAVQETKRIACDEVYPDTTKLYVSVPQPGLFREKWQATELGRMFLDPVMANFNQDMRRQFDENLTQTETRLGLRLSDLDGVAGGEIAFGLLQPVAHGRFVVAMLADVTGRDAEVAALETKVRSELAKRGGKSKQETVDGYALTAWVFPPTKDRPKAQTAYFCRHRDWYASSDDRDTLIAMLQRIDGRGNNVLAKSASYRNAIDRAAQGRTGATHLRWWMEPFGMVESIREANPDQERGRDRIKILQDQGFSAIKGIGGLTEFSTGAHDSLHHIYVYAPQAQRVQAARMLTFPNAPRLSVPSWAIKGFASFLTGNWEMREAFEASKSLVDDLAGSEVFEDALRDIELDPNGLRVNIRKEFIAYLGKRVYMSSECSHPITPQSEQRIVAFELTDPKRVAASLNRAMPNDPNVKKRVFGNQVVWEIIRKENLEQGTPQGFQAFRPQRGAENRNPIGQRPLFKNGAMAVAHGHLFYSTDVEYLGKFLTTSAGQSKLEDDLEYQAVESALRVLGNGSEECIRFFQKMDTALETDYELFRLGKMVDSESLLGQLLNWALAPDEEGLKRKPLVDGSKLPEFSKVRQYLQPGGLRVTNEKDGWRIVGCILARGERSAARP